MPTSDFDWDTDYFDSGFSWFFFIIPGKFRDSPLNETTTASFHIPPNSLCTHPIIRRRIYCLSYYKLQTNVSINERTSESLQVSISNSELVKSSPD
jgi:hypothetical protein